MISAQVVGQLIAGGVNGGAQYLGRGSWRLSTGFAAVPAMAQFAMLLALPESPRWLVTKDKKDEAKDALRRLRGDDAIADELAAVESVVEEERRAKDRAGTIEEEAPVGLRWLLRWFPNDPWLATVRTRARRRALGTGIAIMTFQAFTGINSVMYYGASIARGIGFSREASVWTAAVFDLAQLLGVVCSIARMDRLGRRHVALLSTTGTIFALSMMIAASGAGPPFMVLVSTIIYLFVFGSGLSGVAWTLNSEVHPLVTRSHAQSLAVASNWGANFIVSLTFVASNERYGPAISFVPFFLLTCIALCWMYFLLPETKGVTLEDLERRFQLPLSAFAGPATRGALQCSSSFGDEPPTAFPASDDLQIKEIEMV